MASEHVLLSSFSTDTSTTVLRGFKSHLSLPQHCCGKHQCIHHASMSFVQSVDLSREETCRSTCRGKLLSGNRAGLQMCVEALFLLSTSVALDFSRGRSWGKTHNPATLRIGCTVGVGSQAHRLSRQPGFLVTGSASPWPPYTSPWQGSDDDNALHCGGWVCQAYREARPLAAHSSHNRATS